MFTRLLLLLTPVLAMGNTFCEWEAFLPEGPRRFSLENAIQETLQNQWNIYISENEVSKHSGLLTKSKGPFDPTLIMDFSQQWWVNYTRQLGLDIPDGSTFTFPLIGTVTAHDPGGIRETGETTIAKAELSKMIRIGTTFALGAELNRQKNPFSILEDPYPSFIPLEVDYIREGRASAFFKIKQPLLKGFINGIDRMNEQSQQLQLEASEYHLIHSISEQILDTALAYWDLVKAWKVLGIQKEAEARMQGYVSDIQVLVDKNQYARTELTLPMSSLSASKASVISAGQDIIVAAQKMIFAIGSQANYSIFCDEDIKLDRIPWPKYTELPEFRTLIRKATGIALINRPDIHSLEFQQEAAYKNVLGASNNSLPDLNIELTGRQTNTNYEHGAATPFQPFNMVKPKREITVMLSLNYPLFRSEGIGELRALKAEKREIDLKLDKTKAGVFSSVIDAINQQNALLGEIVESKLAVKEGKKYVSDQEKLFKAGMTDIFQLVDAHTRLVTNELRFIDIHAKVAKNLARIRFLLGLMVSVDKEKQGYLIGNVTQLPEELFLWND